MSSSDIKYPPLPLPAAEQARWTDAQMRHFARDTVLYNAPDAALVLDGLVLGTGTWESIRAAQAALLHRGVKAETRSTAKVPPPPSDTAHVDVARGQGYVGFIGFGPTVTHSGGPYAGHNIPRKSEPEPFDLKRAQAGDPIQTRDGRAVKFVGYDPTVDDSQQIAVVIERTNGTAIRGTRFADGRYLRRGGEQGNDLVMAPKPKPKRDVWVNTFKRPTLSGVLSMAFESEEAALSHARCARSSFASIAVPQEIE